MAHTWNMSQHIAIYVRVSSKRQDQRSQLADLEQWAAAQREPVRWYRDKSTGKTMDRPAWNKLQAALEAGEVSAVVCWRLDRLGRTARGLTALFAELSERGVNLVSLREGIDLSTPAGRMLANVIASIAQYETELRCERIIAGQAAARAAGKSIGGRKTGTRVRLTPEKERTIRRMKRDGESIAAISRAVELSRPTIYGVLQS
jgi:DNA invertase Pin-like site-specific DNA recombinase